jgi:energy-coupling factor transporter ATP-binding protein EcfA2
VTTILKSATATAGFLEGCSVEFSDGLTCIIGARGTCKSTLIESIRFAFNCNQERVEQMLREGSGDRVNSRAGLIPSTLRGGTIQCSVSRQGADGIETYTLEREATATQPRIYRDGVRIHIGDDLLQHIEIYSQSDLQLIAEDERERLALVDRPNKLEIDRCIEQQKSVVDELRQQGPLLRELRQQIDRVRQEVRALPALEAQLDQVRLNRPQLSTEMEISRAQYEQRIRCLSLIKACLPLVRQAGEMTRQMLQPASQLSTLRTQLDVFSEPECAPILAILSQVEGDIRQFVTIGESFPAQQLSDLADHAGEAFEMRNEGYYRLRQQEQDANESLKQEEILQEQIHHLQARSVELEDLLVRETSLLHHRQELRAQVEGIGEHIRQQRMAEIDSINSEHGQIVLLSLAPPSQSANYIEAMMNLLAGSRIREQDQISRDLAGTFTPSELIDLVERGDAATLADALNRDLGQMTRVIAHLTDHEQLYNIEACLPEDRLEITMYDEGVPKPVESLSKGQKATALLPLILRPLPYPLIFDQPEDDLDNSFIFRSLIQTISQLKRHRQLIFVTHNANIPVLGEADQVLVMHMETPVHAAPPLSGTVDDRKQEILDLMEGGAKAFEERGKRYKGLIGRHEE